MYVKYRVNTKSIMSAKKITQRKYEESDEESEVSEVLEESDESDEDENDYSSKEKAHSDIVVLNILTQMLERAYKQITISSQSFDTFVSFIKLYCDIDTEAHTKKLLFNASCTSDSSSVQSIALFMLSNAKCDDNILTSHVAGMDPWLRASRDEYSHTDSSKDKLRIEILKNVSDPTSFLKEKINDRARIYNVKSASMLKHILNLESIDTSLFMIPNNEGYSYFCHMIVYATDEKFKCFLESDKCTRDVITCPGTNKGANYFLSCLLSNCSQKFSMVLKSNKLIDDDFEYRENSKSSPFYYGIFNSNDKKKLNAFLDSQYCTIERVEQYIDAGVRKSDNSTINLIFAHQKFTCLKNKYETRNKKWIKKHVVVQTNDVYLNDELQALKLELAISKMEAERLRLENELLKISPK